MQTASLDLFRYFSVLIKREYDFTFQLLVLPHVQKRAQKWIFIFSENNLENVHVK